MKYLNILVLVSILMAALFWFTDLKFAGIGALFTAWVLLVGSILIDYAKSGNQ